MMAVEFVFKYIYININIYINLLIYVYMYIYKAICFKEERNSLAGFMQSCTLQCFRQNSCSFVSTYVLF